MLRIYLSTARRLFLLLIFLISLPILIQAQTAADYTVNVSTTASTCVQNGSIIIHVKNADGTDLVPGEIVGILYNVYIHGTKTSVTNAGVGGFVDNNNVGQLPPGLYDVEAYLTDKNGQHILLSNNNNGTGFQITGNYKSATYDANLTRVAKPVSLNCFGTGIYSLKINDGAGPYELEFIKKPAAYPNTIISGIPRNTQYFIHNLPAGDYTFVVRNTCQQLGEMSFTIAAASHDMPNRNLNTPLLLAMNFCGTMTSIRASTARDGNNNVSTSENMFWSFFPTDIYRTHVYYDTNSGNNRYPKLRLFYQTAYVTRGQKNAHGTNYDAMGLKWTSLAQSPGRTSEYDNYDFSYSSYSDPNLIFNLDETNNTYSKLSDINNPNVPVELLVRLVNPATNEICYEPVAINLRVETPPNVVFNPTFSHSSTCGGANTTIGLNRTLAACKIDYWVSSLEGGQPKDTLLQGTWTNPNSPTNSIVARDLQRGTTYRFCAKYYLPSGEEVVHCRDFTTTTAGYLTNPSGMTLNYDASCNADPFKATFYFNTGGANTIKLISAPAGYDAFAADPYLKDADDIVFQNVKHKVRMIRLNETVTVPVGSFAPFAINPDYTPDGANGPATRTNVRLYIPEGDYTVELSNPDCDPGRTITYSFKIVYRNKPGVRIDKVSEHFEEKCNEIRYYPFRSDKMLRFYVVDGIPQIVNIYFKVLSTGVTYPTNTNLGYSYASGTWSFPSVQDWYIPLSKRDEAIEISYTRRAYYNSGNYVNFGCEILKDTVHYSYKALNYNRETYYGYRCAGDEERSFIGIEGVNGVAPYSYKLFDRQGGNLIGEKMNVPKGELVTFDFAPAQPGQTKYFMEISDSCGYEIYEEIEVYYLSAMTINNYTRKVCAGSNTDISPINGIDGIVGEGMRYDWEIIDNENGISGLEDAVNQDKIMSGELFLQEGVMVPQTIKIRVTPTYNHCPGQPFEITIVVSPCINYWQGGTDNEWNKPANWTENTVPNSFADIEFATEINNPYFEGIPTSGPAVRDLHVPASDPKTVGKLINETNLATVIPATASLTVTKEIIGSSLPTEAHKLMVGAEKDKANGSLIIDCETNKLAGVYGTVQLYAKGYKGTKETWIDNIEGSPTIGMPFSSEYHWQYFGSPVESIVANPTFYNSKIRMYDETYNGDEQKQFYEKWHWLNTYSTLEAFKGYSITQESPITYSIAGKLQFCDKEVTMTRRAPAVKGADGLTQNVHYGLGQNLFGNSFTSAIDITKLTFPAEVENTVYLYNTGRFHDWATKGELVESNTQLSAGNWFSIPQNSAPAVWDNQIPSLQGFMLKFKDDNAVFNASDVNITLKYTDGGVTANKRPQLAPGAVGFQAAEKAPLSYLRVNLESASTRDALWLISQAGTTNRFDNGWDGRKYFGTPTAYIFTENKDGLMQVNVDKTIDGSTISFYANADTEYELTLIKSNLGQYADLHLLDLVTRTATELGSDTTIYRFSSINQGNVEKRFMIVNTRDVNFDKMKFGMLDAYLKGNNLLVISNMTGADGQVNLFDTSGRMMLTHEMPVGVLEIPVNLSKGVYVVNLTVEGKREPVKIVVR